jgi:hypothetical protein
LKTTAITDQTFANLLARADGRRKRLIGSAVIVLLSVVILLAWYSVASDYSYGSMAGTYVSKVNGAKSALFLNQNGTFQQQLYLAGKVKHAQGTWRRIGEGGIVFSKDILTVAAQETEQANEVYGQVRKRYGLLFLIVTNQGSNSAEFEKQWIY